MDPRHSDALVFFGATGDLAYKKIFPSLQTLIKHGRLDVPVIGVAKAGWNLDQLKARARDSLEKHCELDPAAFADPGTGAAAAPYLGPVVGDGNGGLLQRLEPDRLLQVVARLLGTPTEAA